MSLLNDMLRDLERRGAKDSKADSAELTAVTREQANRWPRWLAVAVVLAGSVALVWGNWAKEQAPTASSERLSDQTFELAPTAKAEPVVQSLPASNAMPGRTDGPKLDQVAPAAQSPHQVTIDNLIAEAKRAMERDRLTSPSDDNAYDRYQQILLLSPEHPQALAGIERIVRRYETLIEHRLDHNEWARADTLLHRAKMIDPNHPAMAALEQRLHTKQTADKTGSVEEAHLEVTRNAASEDQYQSRQAQEALQQGRYREARERLEAFVAAQPNAPYSNAKLVSIYIDQGEIEAALKQLEWAEFPTGERTRLRARVDLVQGRPELAIERLEADLNEAQPNERYRALLAGLYYQSDRHAEATSAYRRLLESFGDRPAYWLGLALALDAQQHEASASAAYRHALDSGHYDTPDNRNVRDYITQRLVALSR